MTKNKHQCPRCSGRLQKLSGFEVCDKCGYTMDSQSLDTDWLNTSDIGIKRISDADRQFKPYRENNPRRRTPLNFNED